MKLMIFGRLRKGLQNAIYSNSNNNDWFIAKCLENSVASQGKNIDEAMANLKEALELYFEDSDEIPSFGRLFVTTLEVAV